MELTEAIKIANTYEYCEATKDWTAYTIIASNEWSYKEYAKSLTATERTELKKSVAQYIDIQNKIAQLAKLLGTR